MNQGSKASGVHLLISEKVDPGFTIDFLINKTRLREFRAFLLSRL